MPEHDLGGGKRRPLRGLPPLHRGSIRASMSAPVTGELMTARAAQYIDRKLSHFRWFCILVLPLPNCVTLGKIVSLSVCHFLILLCSIVIWII